MKIKIFQKGFNYSQDGPGNRLVYHLQGCNMRCLWCSNPEGLDMSGEKSSIYTVEDVVREVIRSKKMFFDGGGVTFTGGEATCQFDALKVILIKLKENGINTCIETNATHTRLSELVPYVDFIIMDFKHYDDNKHKDNTGISNKHICENLKMLAKCAKDYEQNVLVRTPLIHNFNDDKEDVKGFLELYQSFDASYLKFEFLEYHEYGKDKWNEAHMKYRMVDGFIEAGRKSYFENQLKSIGYNVIHT
ncbi:MAG: radical SAM protein [Suipraeoptans sp.]